MQLHYEDNSEDELDKVLMDTTIKVEKTDHLIIATFKLPVKVVKNSRGELQLVQQNDFMNTLPSLFKLKKKELLNFTWVGWPDYIAKNPEEETQITEML